MTQMLENKRGPRNGRRLFVRIQRGEKYFRETTEIQEKVGCWSESRRTFFRTKTLSTDVSNRGGEVLDY